MGQKGKKKRGSSFFGKLEGYVWKSPAFRDLTPDARALWLELLMRYNGHNNGQIGLGIRGAAASINKSRSTTARGFQELVDHGFIEVASPSSFHQKKLSREWLMTEFRDDRTGALPLKTFMKWKSDEGLPPATAKNQNPVPPANPTVPNAIQEHREKAVGTTNRPTAGSKKPKSGQSQSQEPDTSISAPPPVLRPYSLSQFALRKSNVTDKGTPTFPGSSLTTSNDNPDVRHRSGQVDTGHKGAGQDGARLSYSEVKPPIRMKAQSGSQRHGGGVEPRPGHPSNDNTVEGSISTRVGDPNCQREQVGDVDGETNPLVLAVLRTFPGARVVF